VPGPRGSGRDGNLRTGANGDEQQRLAHLDHSRRRQSHRTGWPVDVRYSTTAITSANFASATRWTSVPTPAASGTKQTTTITGLQPNTAYWFAIKTADEVPNWAGISNIITRTTLAAPDTIRPAALNASVTAPLETRAIVAFAATGDDSLTGTATTYDVRYSASPITIANWGAATQVTGEPAPMAPGTAQTVTINGLTRQTIYYFAARIIDEAGNPSALSNVVSVTTPDLSAPAAIRDLAVGFLWFGWSTDVPMTHRYEAALPREHSGR